MKVKLKPTIEQADAIRRTMSEFNVLCNIISKKAFENREFSKLGIQKKWYDDLRNQSLLTSQLVIRAIAKVAEAYKVKERRASLCEFRPDGAIIYDQRILRFKSIDVVNLWTMDGRLDVRMVMTGYQKANMKRGRGQADLVVHDGVFYLLVVVEFEDGDTFEPDKFIGADLGIVNVAVSKSSASLNGSARYYTGESVEGIRKKYHNLRKRLQACGSRSAKRKLKKISRKESDFRRNENHKISKQIVSDAKAQKAAIGLEELKDIRSRTTVRKSERSKHSGWSFYQLQTFIQYKAKEAGVPVLFVDPAYTSKGCPICGNADKRNRPTQAKFKCVGCGLEGHADEIGAYNIALRAAKQYAFKVNRPNVADVLTRKSA